LLFERRQFAFSARKAVGEQRNAARDVLIRLIGVFRNLEKSWRVLSGISALGDRSTFMSAQKTTHEIKKQNHL
jgi:hypothetical protein